MLKILVVDDELGYRTSLEKLLRSYGFEVKSAVGREEACGIAKHFLPDVLVVDWMLQAGDTGLDVAQAIRGICPNVPTFLITGFLSEELESMVQASPLTQFVAKPFLIEELVERIRDVLTLATKKTR